ncbi:hypothetical protein CRV01_11080 [Arcobacter sp. CECT 8983]|uniref:LptE family protein n=1 Tax=Arcobacter sp. CECT 8983 TaxID=2044508 RepID=UPI00100A4CC5|nr:LptE family protein [Arcobacter sp. CECT 8983]RXJ89151.1 hypothetical protein CRV01_11080 [Arcobacter sp. CECT 8983]
MKVTLSILFTALLSIFIIACSNKKNDISNNNEIKINKNIETIYVNNIENDNLNLKEHLKEELKKQNNKQIAVKKEKTDATIRTEILSSNMNYEKFYKPTNTIRCLNYKIENNARKCIEYGNVKIPCKKKEFELKTKIDLISKEEKVIFSKIYEQKFSKDICKNIKYSFDPTYYLPNNSKELIQKYNTKLAKKIAKDSINDINLNIL